MCPTINQWIFNRLKWFHFLSTRLGYRYQWLNKTWFRILLQYIGTGTSAVVGHYVPFAIDTGPFFDEFRSNSPGFCFIRCAQFCVQIYLWDCVVKSHQMTTSLWQRWGDGGAVVAEIWCEFCDSEMRLRWEWWVCYRRRLRVHWRLLWFISHVPGTIVDKSWISPSM